MNTESLTEKQRLFLEDLRDRLDALACEVEDAIKIRPRLLDEEQASRYLSLSAAYLAQLRKGVKGPKYIKIGRYVRYDYQDLDAWISERARR